MRNLTMLTGMFLLVALFFLKTAYPQDQVLTDISPKPEFPEINAVNLNGTFTFILRSGEEQNLILEGDTTLIEVIKVKVSDHTLYVSGNLPTRTNARIIFTYKDLFLVKTNGAAVVRTDGPIKTDDLRIDAGGASNLVMEIEAGNLYSKSDGAATVTLKGSARMHETHVGGAGTLSAYQLLTDTTQARISGAGDARVNTTARLAGHVSGAGDLKYIGAPVSLQVEQSGAGDLKNVDVADTTSIRLGKAKVLIIDDKNTHQKPRKRARFNGHWGGVELGVNGMLNAANSFKMPLAPVDYSFLELKQNQSFRWSINLFESNYNLIGQKLGLITGLGFEFNNYRFDNRIIIMSDSSRLYHVLDTINKPKKSKLAVCYLNVPLILEFQSNPYSKSNSLHIGVGVIGSMRVGSYTRINYTNSKGKYISRDDFYLNPFKYELTARLGWGKINLFANYALSELFKKGKGPEVYPVTVGITLVNW